MTTKVFAVERLLENKKIIIFTGCACVGGYVAYRYWKKRLLQTIDEGFDEVTQIDNNEKRVICLGLEGAGKTSVLNQLVAANDPNYEYDVSPLPTGGFAIHKIQKGQLDLDICEFGGSEGNRQYWSNFMLDTDLLIFLVDSADIKTLTLATLLLKELIGEPQVNGIKKMPVLVIANKQDLTNALTTKQIEEAMDLHCNPCFKHDIEFVGCQARPFPSTFDSKTSRCNWYHPSIINVLEKIIHMSSSFKSQ